MQENVYEKPTWLPKTIDPRKLKSELKNVYNPEYTQPGRALGIVELLEGLIEREKLTKMNFLEVGVGEGNGMVKCPYEPYQLVSVLAKAGIDYKGTIVDFNGKALENVTKRTKLFYLANNSVDLGENAEEREALAQTGWKSYLTRTGQALRIVNQPDPELIFRGDNLIPFFRRRQEMANLKRGVLVADVPSEFIKKLKNGEVSTVLGDIRQIDLAKFGDFDFVSCMHVFHYMNELGQSLAMYNMSQKMKPGAVMVFNDDYRNRVMETNGGWLNDEKLEDLKLEPDSELTALVDDPQTHVLRKVV